MIKRIVLRNFQIHKRLELNFDKRLNVLTGSNDSGKSSIIRAIYWLMYNSPFGDWMRRINKQGIMETTSVKIIFDDDTIIQRIKGDGINKYIVDDEVYENFGYSIPQQVLKKIKIYPFVTNKENFNVHISMQDEQPFLIHESAPVKASVLDTLTGNSVLQKAISSFNKENIQISKDIGTLEDTIKDDEETLKKIPDLNEAQKRIDNVNKMIADKMVRVVRVSYYSGLKQDYDKQIFIKQKTSKLKLDLGPIKKMLDESTILKEDLKKLKNLKEDLKKFVKSIIPLPDMSGLFILIEKAKKIRENLADIKECKNTLDGFYESAKQSIKEIKIAENELGELREKNPLCPVCRKKW